MSNIIFDNILELKKYALNNNYYFPKIIQNDNKISLSLYNYFYKDKIKYYIYNSKLKKFAIIGENFSFELNLRKKRNN